MIRYPSEVHKTIILQKIFLKIIKKFEGLSLIIIVFELNDTLNVN